MKCHSPRKLCIAPVSGALAPPPKRPTCTITLQMHEGSSASMRCSMQRLTYPTAAPYMVNHGQSHPLRTEGSVAAHSLHAKQSTLSNPCLVQWSHACPCMHMPVRLPIARPPAQPARPPADRPPGQRIQPVQPKIMGSQSDGTQIKSNVHRAMRVMRLFELTIN